MDLDGLSPDQLRVQLYAEGLAGAPADVQDMVVDPMALPGGVLIYRAEVPDDRPALAYTARVIVNDATGLAVPLEVGLIAWQR
jgi:starch phosphorylase